MGIGAAGGPRATGKPSDERSAKKSSRGLNRGHGATLSRNFPKSTLRFCCAALLYLSFRRDVVPVFRVEPEVARLDLAVQAVLVLVVERGVPGKDDVDDHPGAPHVHRLKNR